METNKTNDMVVAGAETVTETKKQTVTQKTLKSWNEQCGRIVSDGLLDKEEAKILAQLSGKIRLNWINKNLG